ncbi:MAG: TIGR04086 family membrane protein [Eubacteriales bacterium]
MERMVKKTEEKSEGIGLIVKIVAGAYGITFLALLLLAFCVYHFQLNESVVSISMIITYVFTTFISGYCMGKKVIARKFLWGLLSGGGYFVVLLCLSFLVHPSEIEIGNHMVTTMILCCASGMLGGMVA